MTYSVLRSSFSGLSIPPDVREDKADARASVARRIRGLRRQGYPVTTLERGKEWEIGEPEGCAMVPDACGTISIRHVTFDCRECDCPYETKQEARECDCNSYVSNEEFEGEEE